MNWCQLTELVFYLHYMSLLESNVICDCQFFHHFAFLSFQIFTKNLLFHLLFGTMKVLPLLIFSFILYHCVSSEFTEDLVVFPLADGNRTLAYFQFTIDDDSVLGISPMYDLSLVYSYIWLGKHYGLFPRNLGDLAKINQIEEFHLSLTKVFNDFWFILLTMAYIFWLGTLGSREMGPFSSACSTWCWDYCLLW